MSLTDRSRLKLAQASDLQSNTGFTTDPGTPVTGAVPRSHQRTMSVYVPAGLANTSYAYGIARATVPMQIVSVRYADSTNVTASNSNFVTFSLTQNDDAGGAATTIASNQTNVNGTNNLTLNQSVSITMSSNAATAAVAAGQGLQFKATQTSSGVAFGPGFAFITWEEV